MRRVVEGWAQLVVNRRWLVISVILLLTVLSLVGFSKLHFYNKFTSWLSQDDPVISLFIEVSEKFSSNELAMILIRPTKGVFTNDFLTRLKTFTEAMDHREEIFLVTSLANIGDIKPIAGGIEVRDLLAEVPRTPAEMARFKQYVLSKESFRSSVISANGQWVSVSLFISSAFDSEQVLKNIILPEADKFFAQDAELYFTGIPSDAHFLNEFAVKDLTLLTPLIVVVIALILFASFRSLKGVLFPSLVVMLSSIWLFGLMGHLGQPMTFVTTAIPVLLTALGSAYGIHILNKFNHDLHGAAGRQLARLQESTAAIFMPVILAGATTFVGFLSFKSAKLSLVADFGFFAAIGIALALLIALSLVPALSSFAAFDKISVTKGRGMSKVLDKTAGWVIRRPRLVFILSLVLLLLFAAGIPKIKKEINFVEYYPQDSLPRLGHRIADQNFDGAYPVIFYLAAEDVKRPDVLRVLRRAENFLLSIKDVGVPGSIVSLIQELNLQLNGRSALPESAGAVANLWFFVDGREELKQLIADDNKETLVFARSADSRTRYNKRLAARLDAFLREDVGTKLMTFDLQKLPPDQGEALRQLEIDHLCDEVCWLAARYVAGKIDRPAVRQILAGARAVLAAGSAPAILLEQKRSLGDYIFSEGFDFLISDAAKQAINESLADRIDEGTFSQAGALAVLKRFVPPGEFAEDVAIDAARTMLFKWVEAGENAAADMTWQELKRMFASKNPGFAKRVKSIVYDLLDNLVVLPAHKTGDMKGESVPIKRLEQSGSPALLSRLDHYLTSSQIQSLLLAYFLVLLLMSLMRRSVLLGLVSTIPVAFTIALMYGFLGHTGMPLDYTTMMIGGISIGVGIDYAIHLVHGTAVEIDRGLSIEEAIRAIVMERGKAILANAAAVMAGFAVLLFSSMLILRNFGATMMAAMFLAAASALTVLPAAILVLKPKLKRKGGKHG